MPCNKSDADINRKWWGLGLEVELYLSDDDIEYIDEQIELGAKAAGVYAALVRLGIVSGALTNPYSIAIGSIVLFYIEWIKYSNDGCGVEVSTTLRGSAWGGVSVKAQTEDDGWWPW